MDSSEMNESLSGADFFFDATSPPPRKALPCSAVDRTYRRVLVKTEQIKYLMSNINSTSIMNAIYKNPGVPINEIKLWDLIPNDLRHRYLEMTFSDDEEWSESSDVEPDRPKNLPKDVASQKSRTTTSNGSKRAPDVDICTVESKKSFTNADLMNLRPGTVSTASENFGSTTDRSINRGAIRKVRFQTSTPQKSSYNIMYDDDVDEIYENLLEIFPDADPHYLRHSAEKYLGRADDLQKFVKFNLVKLDYPTKDEYMARLKITKQHRQYTTGFNVQNFLAIIPDPSKHFMNPQRKCAYDTVAFEFLKSLYNKNRVGTISRTYAGLNYNLTLTADNLLRLGPDMKTGRNVCDMPTDDIKLLQEIAFIRNRTDIENHLQHVKEEDSRKFAAFKKRLRRQCCYDSECIPRKCSTCNKRKVSCNNCVLGETSSSKFLKAPQAAEVLANGIEDLVSCTFCHFHAIPPEGDNIFKCLHPECTKESYRWSGRRTSSNTP